MVNKRDLRIGNMFEQGIVWKISGRAGAKVHLHGKGKWYKGFRTEVAVEDLKPILLTPEVLVEWCGFEELGFDMYEKDRVTVFLKGKYKGIGINTGHFPLVLNKGQYLHELQNVWYVYNNAELEIKG